MCLLTTARTAEIVFARSAGSEAMYCAGVLTFAGGFMDSSSPPHPLHHRFYSETAAGDIVADAVTMMELFLLLRRVDLVLLQVLVEEDLHAIPDRHPAAVKQRFVRVVGHHEQLVRHLVRAEQIDEAHHLREVDVAVVVSLNQQHRRLP